MKKKLNRIVKKLIFIALLVIIMLSSTGNVFANNLKIINSYKLSDAMDWADPGGGIISTQPVSPETSSTGGSTTDEEEQKSNIGLSNSTSVTSGFEASSSDVLDMVSITENGYEINANYALRILRTLEEYSVDTLALGLRDEDYDFMASDDESQTYKSDEELTNIVDKYIRTELKNMLPDIGDYAKTAINGNVVVKRYTAKFGRYNAQDEYEVVEEGGTDFEDGITLEYIPYDKLVEMSKETVYSHEQTEEYLKYFSINPNGLKLCVLTSEEKYTWKYNNPPPERAIDDSGTNDPAEVELLPSYYNTADIVENTFELRQYEYLNLLEQTAAPLNFFLAMHMMTQDVDFMNDLLEECNKENTYIELGLLEATESEFEHYNYGTDEKDAIRGGTISSYLVEIWQRWQCCNDTTSTSTDPETGEEVPETTHNPHEGGPEMVGTNEGTYLNNVEEVYETCLKYAGYVLKDFLHVEIKNTGDLYLIEADTWNIDYKLIPKVGDVERPFDGIQSVTRINPTYVPYVDRLTPAPPTRIGEHCEANHYSDLIEWRNTHFFIYENYATWKNEYHVYSIINGSYKIDFIINLIKEYPQVENNLSTASYLLFALLEQNGNTQELERYMRYTLAELSGYQYLTDNSKELEINFAVGLSLDSLYSYNYDGSTSGYTVDVDSYATSSASGKKSGGSGRTAWHLEKLTTITTTDQDGELIVSREYHYFKQEKGTNICGRTSLATCLSGLGVVNPSTGQPYTPTEISPENTNMWFSWAQSVAGVSATKYTNNIRTKLTEHLTAGNPAIVHIKANSDPNNPYNTSGGHFIAVVGIKFSGDTLVYVLDPGSSRTNRTENYININTVLEYADEVRLFSK